MKTMRPFTRVATVVVALFAAALAFAQNTDQQSMSDEEKAAVLSRVQYVLSTQAFVPGVDFEKWPDMIKKSNEKFQTAKTKGEFALAINSLMESYGFSHIGVFPPSFGDQRSNLKRGGIGIRVQVEEGGLRVTHVFKESPAATAGFRVGDLVVECDGKPVKATPDLAGENGQKSEIKVVRKEGDAKLSVTRADYKTLIPETLAWQGDVAIIHIPTFDVGYDKQNIEQIMGEAVPKASAIVLDLRGNGGGRVTNLQHLASFFLDSEKDPMGTFIGRPQVDAYEKVHGPSTDLKAIAMATRYKVKANKREDLKVSVPVAVLVDQGSASASEMMAAALKEVKGSKVIGAKSAGAVLASMILPLETSGFWIQFPVTDYITIGGARLEGNGVSPDFLAKPVVWGETDDGVAVALKALGKS